MSSPVQVKIRRLRDTTDLPLPTQMTAGSAGFDLCAAINQPVTLGSMQRQLIPCGFAIAVPAGYEAQVRPRSGLAAKQGITLVNSPGTIDSDYRGEVCCVLINLSATPFIIERGMRIAQIIICPVPEVQLLEVVELDDTARGTQGFGHTGH